MTREEIIEKVQKLLALATSPNENEAKLAASMAHKLLAKYNLSIEQVEEAKIAEEYEAVDKETRGSRPMEDKYIYGLLQKYFYVKIVTQKFYEQRVEVRDGYRQNRYRKRYKFTIVGRKHNVQIARYVYDFLFRSFRSAFVDFCKNHGVKSSDASAAARRGYYHGLYLGLRDQLEANVQKALAEAKMMVVAEDPNIKKYMEQVFGQLGQGRAQKETPVNRAALEAGYRDGQNMKIAVGITGSTEAQKQVGQIMALEDKR